MSHLVTLEISDDIVQRASEIAKRTHRSIEEVLTEWFAHGGTEPPVEMLSDEEVLKLADMQMEPEEDEELSNLLAANREGEITEQGKVRLEELMQIYRKGMVRKAHALQVAVKRGLRPPLS